jgi:hypothetical protein
VRAVEPRLRQAAALIGAAGVARAILSEMEDDPAVAVESVREGATLLPLVRDLVAASEGRFSLGELRKAWAKRHSDAPDETTLSRRLAAFEEAGLIHRSGLTSARRTQLLDKALVWLEKWDPTIKPPCPSQTASDPNGIEVAAEGAPTFESGSEVDPKYPPRKKLHRLPNPVFRDQLGKAA